VRDKRNNSFEPTGGYYIKLSSEWAGLGGDKFWWRNELDGRYFKKLVGNLVLRSRYFLGSIHPLKKNKETGLPRTEKYTLGGSRNLRGYRFEAIGPKKYTDEKPNGFNLGGKFSTFATLELEHPLVREAGLKWVVFYDAGHAGNSDNIIIRQDYGFGFRWFSPIGILRFEFGYPIDPNKTDDSSQFHFDIGQLF
jgi:outer membrane protein insertion porin family